MVEDTAVERFLKFLPNISHKALKMKDAVIATLTDFSLNLNDCRGQSYTLQPTCPVVIQD